MGCKSSKNRKEQTMLIIIDSPPPSLPSSRSIINVPQCETLFPASKLPVFKKLEKIIQEENPSLEYQQTNEDKLQIQINK